MIPKILYTYWGNSKLSWLRYLTIVSFKKYNPEYEIKVYYPIELTKNISWETKEQDGEFDGEDYFDKLKDIAEVIPFDVEPLGFSNSLPEVHKSGIFRYYMLSHYGGVYCDMDILFTKPINLPDVSGIYSYQGYYSDGFLACEKYNPVYSLIYENLQISTTDYQAYGPNQWYCIKPEGLFNTPKEYLYYYDADNLDKLFDKVSELPEESLGVHWYGGHPKTREWENLLTSENYINYNNTITKIINNME
jgi:hypothetical protein